MNALDLFQSEDGLIFEVKDYDTIGTNESLGAFTVNARTLYKWNGERREFALKPLLGQHDFHQGTVALRARRATAHDIQFIEKYNEKKKKVTPFTFIELAASSAASDIAVKAELSNPNSLST